MRKNLKLLRVEHDLTQEQMAERLGVARSTYNRIETGKSAGTTAFWLAVHKEFPKVDIAKVAKGAKE